MPDIYGQRLTQTYILIVKPKVSPCTFCITYAKNSNNEISLIITRKTHIIINFFQVIKSSNISVNHFQELLLINILLDIRLRVPINFFS